MLPSIISSQSWRDRVLVENVGSEIARRIDPGLEDVRRSSEIAVSEQTFAIVASHAALAQTFGAAFDDLTNVITFGFDGVTSSIRDLEDATSHGLSAIKDELEVQTRELGDIRKRLESVDKTLLTPSYTRAQELFQQGRQWGTQGLLREAVEALQKGIEIYPVDFAAHYALGILYLEGRNETDDVIDLAKAEHHLLLAARYGRPLIGKIKGVEMHYTRALFCASCAAYAQAGEYFRNGDVEQATEQIQLSARLSAQVLKLSSGFSEAKYQLAKCLFLLGQPRRGAWVLRGLCYSDRSFMLRAGDDPDFDPVRERVDALFEKMRRNAPRQYAAELVKLRGIELAEPARSELDAEIGRCDELVAGGTYFDYYDVLPRIREALQYALLHPWHEFYKEVFGIERDFSNIKIPERREGFTRLIVVAKGMTPHSLALKCEELFKLHSSPTRDSNSLLEMLLRQSPYPDDVVRSVRRADVQSYAVWVRDLQEADVKVDLKKLDDTTDRSFGPKEFGELDASSITLEERLLLELEHFTRTRGHLDLKTWTLCVGSSFRTGGKFFTAPRELVPLMHWCAECNVSIPGEVLFTLSLKQISEFSVGCHIDYYESPFESPFIHVMEWQARKRLTRNVVAG